MLNTRSRFRPNLEHLEDRLCPSFTTSFQSGTLTLTGTPLTATTAGQELLIQRAPGAGTNYQVIDNYNANTMSGGVSLGTYAISRDLHLNLTHYNKPITIDLNGGSFPGSIYLSLGQGLVAPIGGFNPITITGTNGAGTAQVNGSVYITGGDGAETVDIGSEPTFPGATEPVNVAGIVSFSGNPVSASGGNSLTISSGSTVLTDVDVTQVTSVTVNGASTTPALSQGVIARNLNVSDANAGNSASVDITGRVSGNVTMSGSNSAFGDTFETVNGGVGPAGSVGGSVSLTLGSGGIAGNFISVGAGTTVGGNFAATGGSGGVFALFPGTVGGSMNLNFGSGANTIDTTGGTVGTSLSVTLGNGSNLVTLDGTVGGSATFNMGNALGGNDLELDAADVIAGSVFVTMGNSTGGNMFNINLGSQILGPTVRYIGGTFNDEVTLGNGLANPFALDVIFQGGTRALHFANNSTPASAYIDFGTGPGSKLLDYGGEVVTWNQTLLNYP